ncbi:hypothetical protein K470DRAFT_272404 [Piedraia hortae CBS 480.64]|uniref:F-box domain-containing protein n=1 Tax=Piedraia hortae CBS 480.64 TaxID=1314780 RepID=A0A6A7BTJ4_9PEZI|nr:hypothetical protein K470DRAFT_272404 [Piedraia hortae CBS 480.64]
MARPLPHIPAELQFMIIRQMDTPTLFNALTVCSAWFEEAVEQLWHTVDLQVFLQLPRKTAQRYVNMTEALVCKSQIPWYNLGTFFFFRTFSFPRLRHFTLLGKLDHWVIQEILQLLRQNLESLHVRSPLAYKVFEILSSPLPEVKFLMYDAVWFRQIDELNRVTPGLRILQVHVIEMTRESFQSISHLTGLEELHLEADWLDP